MTTARSRTCPFDQQTMEVLPAGQAVTMLVDLLLSPRSPLYGMVRGAANGVTRADQEFHRCPGCGFFAMFIR